MASRATDRPGGCVAGNIGRFAQILGQLADSEEQIANQAKAALLKNLNNQDLIFDQAMSLAMDLSLAAWTAIEQKSTTHLIIVHGLARGLLLGLKEAGQDLYGGAYLTMRGMMMGAEIHEMDLYRVADEGSRVILSIAEQYGAEREAIIRSLAEAALEGEFSYLPETKAIESLFLQMFEPSELSH